MSTGTLPEELIDRIMGSIGDDVATLIALSKSNKRWAQLSRPYLLSNLAFKDQRDIVDFSVLLQAPHHTFPPSIRCQELALRNATTISDKTPTSVMDVLASITVKKSFKIHVTDGRIPRTVVQVSTAWINITQLTLSGRGYNAPATFYYLSSFTGLESLQLEDFSFMVAEGGTESTMEFSLPSTVTRLATIRSSSVWTFFSQRVIPGGGLSSIRHLRIEALFCVEEPGVWNMVECLGNLCSIEILELSALYDANSRDFNSNMYNIFQTQELTLMKRPGLRHLELDFSRVPAKIALSTLAMHAAFVPISASDVAVTVDICVPDSLTLWDQSNPGKQLRQHLGETSPPGTPPTTGQCTLTLRGFPGDLSKSIRAGDTVRVWGYPIAIIEATGVRNRELCEASVSPRGLVIGYWKRLKDSITGFYARAMDLWRRILQ